MKRKIPLLLLCILFLGLTGYYCRGLYREWREYRRGEEVYAELAHFVSAEPVFSPSEEPEVPVPETSADSRIPGETVPEAVTEAISWPVVDFEALQAINPDVVAWITIEGTNIHYPVVQGTDNDYYLDHLMDGTENGAGSIFLDYRNDSAMTDRNSILYGHNMQNGSMFNQITKYRDQAYYDAHPACLVMTPKGNYRLAFFAGYVTDLNSQAWKLEFASDEEYVQWLEEAVSNSLFAGAVEPTERDRVITFSTCTYDYTDARFVLVGVLQS